ncbi:MAG TPA: ROK family protein [Steroidobacteraceae bacterium]
MPTERVPLGELTPPEWIKPISKGGRAMLDLLLKRGPLSQASFATLLELSQPSVARLVSGFETEGILRLGARRATGPGHPSVTLTLNPDYAYGLGVTLEGDALSMAILDLSGTVRALRTVAMPDMGRRSVLDRLGSLKIDLLREADIDARRIVGSGVGFAGFFVVNPLNFNPADLLADWTGADVAATLAPVLGTAVVCDNSATTATIAESLLGVGRACANFAYCHLNNGFGGGLVFDGRVMRGAHGNAGDFGGVWWLLNKGYPNLDRLRLHVSKHGTDFKTVEQMSHALSPDTPGVEDWIVEAEPPFAMLAFLLGHMVAPEKVVIGGRLPGWLATRLAEKIVLPASPPRNARPFPLPQIVAREVEGDASAIGAAAMPLQRFFFA